MAEFDEVGYERDFPREKLRAKAEIMVDEESYHCVVDDISASGARLKIELEVGRGKDVLVSMCAFGPFNATVAWCNGGAIGVKFDHDPEEMTKVLIVLESQG